MPRLVEIGSVVLEKKIFKTSMYFRFFIIISPWKRAWDFIWTNLNLNPLHLWMICAKFDRNWPCSSGEEDENVKSLQTDRRTDRRRTKSDQKAHLSFQLRWAKKNIIQLEKFTIVIHVACNGLFEFSDVSHL